MLDSRPHLSDSRLGRALFWGVLVKSTMVIRTVSILVCVLRVDFKDVFWKNCLVWTLHVTSNCHSYFNTVSQIWGRSGWPQRASPSYLTVQGSSELFNVRLYTNSKCLCLWRSCFASDIANPLLHCSWRLGSCAWYSFCHHSSDPLLGGDDIEGSRGHPMSNTSLPSCVNCRTKGCIQH